MTGKLYIPDLRAAANQRPAGYLDEVLFAGRVEGDVLHIEHAVYFALRTKYAPRIQPVSLSQKALNLAGAGGRVIKATAKGEKISVSSEEQERRMSICIACPHFVAKQCELCGCVARWKTKLATESCPIGKW